MVCVRYKISVGIFLSMQAFGNVDSYQMPAEDPLVRNYYHLDGMEFYRIPYYEKGSAPYRVIAAQVFRHFLPYSPRAVFVYQEGEDKKKNFVGIAIESVEATQLIDNQIAIRNRAYDDAMGLLHDESASKADPNLTLNKIDEWTALAQYLRLSGHLDDIATLPDSRNVISMRCDYALQYPHSDLACLTTETDTGISYQCNDDKIASMWERIEAEKSKIQTIVDNTFSVLDREFPSDKFSQYYKPYAIRILGL